MDLRLSFRDLEAADLSDLDWSGGPEHIRAVAAALEASYAGEVALLVGSLPNDRLIAMGGVDFRTSEAAGSIWMLAVHERFQSLGIGTQLITALERKIIDHGRPMARMLVEHDNPRARTLYERLGYAEAGAALDSWPVGGAKTYVTACTIMERPLAERSTMSMRCATRLRAMSLSFTFAVLLICGVAALGLVLLIMLIRLTLRAARASRLGGSTAARSGG